MLVDINLLPKKNKGKPLSLFVFMGVCLLCLLLLFLVLFTYMSQKHTYENLKGQLQITKQVREKLQGKTEKSPEPRSAKMQYDSSVEYVNHLPHSTVFLLKQFDSLLPSGSYILNFNYDSDKTIHLTMHFDSLKTTSRFMSTLDGTKFVSTVNLNNVTSEQNGCVADFDVIINDVTKKEGE